MTWTSDAAIIALTAEGEPDKGSNIRKVQANINAAFGGEMGAPALAKSVSQTSQATHGFGELGTYTIVYKETTAAGNPYTNGDDIAGTPFGLTGTWQVMGQVETLPYDGGGPTNGKFVVQLLRIS